MKTLIATLAAATVLAAPAVSFAQQDNGALTRAQVKAELATLERAGYNPAASRLDYPVDIQAAVARVGAQQPQLAQQRVADTSGYGGEAVAKREAGGPSQVRRIADGAPIYRGR